MPEVSLHIQGSSMWPQLRSGERVVLEVPHRNEPQRGEVVLVPQPEGYLLHRIVSVWHREGQKFYLTRGDNSPGADYPVASTEVIGRLVALERHSRLVKVDHGLRRIWGICLGHLSYAELKLLILAKAVRFRLRQLFNPIYPV